MGGTHQRRFYTHRTSLPSPRHRRSHPPSSYLSQTVAGHRHLIAMFTHRHLRPQGGPGRRWQERLWQRSFLPPRFGLALPPHKKSRAAGKGRQQRAGGVGRARAAPPAAPAPFGGDTDAPGKANTPPARRSTSSRSQPAATPRSNPSSRGEAVGTGGSSSPRAGLPAGSCRPWWLLATGVPFWGLKSHLPARCPLCKALSATLTTLAAATLQFHTSPPTPTPASSAPPVLHQPRGKRHP